MKKNNKKGFIMAETIAVSAVVVTILVIIYAQFSSVYNSFYKTFKYNSVNNLYLARNVKNYVANNLNENLINSLNGDTYYVDLSSCPLAYLNNHSYCKALYEASDIETVIFTHENLDLLKESLNEVNVFKESMNNFIKYINYSGDGYRIIIEFKDNTFATLLLSEVSYE